MEVLAISLLPKSTPIALSVLEGFGGSDLSWMCAYQSPSRWIQIWAEVGVFPVSFPR
ncbi:hypothetical protein CKA32_001228 [Geitlerinema sp. FC II]|nr:hypothetical protein CKA32_001228 [Geitlerinema sp. FC II]